MQPRSARIVDVDLRAPAPSPSTETPVVAVPSSSRRNYLPAVVAIGATAALATGAMVTGVLGHAKYTRFETLNAAPSVENRDERDALRSSGRALYTANALLLGWAALAGATAAYFFVRPPLRRSSATRGGVWVTFGPGSLVAGARF
jgi:hypothetical protein